ncbi:unnamed protein product [Coregonus sp. 'balchen']|nr:unnamed protein product [Coregonus sp. 'balchen']
MDPLRRIAVQEDMVQYCLFLVQPNLSDTQADELHLQQLVEEILAKVAPLLMQYIWQQQPFNLKYHTEKGIGEFLHTLEAVLCLGTAWRMSGSSYTSCFRSHKPSQNLLPGRVEHTVCKVFLHRGELYILPCPSRCSGDGLPRDAVPSVTQALALLSSHTHACLASPKNRTALEKRLEGYPEKIQANLHHAHCFLPAGIATVLAQRPDLVAPAVSSFYLRDPVDLQACRTFQTFPPRHTSPNLMLYLHVVYMYFQVTFTRCLYAQIQQQHFTPDRRSGFTLPARSHPLYRAQELGMKLAHGFEILCSKCRQPSSEPDAPISCNPLWKRLLNSLKKNGYLKVSEPCITLLMPERMHGSRHAGELQGSAYCRVLLQAVSHPNTQLRWQGPRGELAGYFSPAAGVSDEELDSDDLDDVDEGGEGPSGLRGDEGADALEGLRKYMDEMDHELMGTKMGQSFNEQQGTNKAGPAANGFPPTLTADDKHLPSNNDHS